MADDLTTSRGGGLVLCQGTCSALCLCTGGRLTVPASTGGIAQCQSPEEPEPWEKAGSDLDTALRWRWFPLESHQESSDGR